jgi:hypothetical protein
MAKNLDTAKAKLTIVSRTLLPEEISRRVGIPWDDVRRMGDRKGKSDQLWDVNVWCLYETSEGKEAASPVDLALHECLNRLRERLGTEAVAAIHGLSRTETVELGLYMLAQNVPPILLSADTLAFIHQLRAELDIDIVLYGDE